MKAIIIIGAARSGTKMLGNIFSLHPKTNYFGEINHLWRTGNQNLKHDMIPNTKENVNRIRKKIREIYNDEYIFVEKTAANSLRLPLINDVFDEVKYIHIVRDGRDVALSASKKWRGENSKFEIKTLNYENEKKAIFRRIKYRLKEVNLKEFLSLFPKGLKITMSYIGMKNETYWGPLVPGISDFRKSHSLLEACAYQWYISESSILNFKISNKTSIKCFDIKYEELCKNSEEEIKKIFEFCNLPIEDDIDRYSKTIKGGNTSNWLKSLNIDEIHRIQDMSASILEYHNYKLI